MNPCPEYLQLINGKSSRRDLLRGFTRLAVAGISSALVPGLLPRVAFGAGTGKREIIVCIFLRGGADGLSFVAPYTEDLYYTNRPTLALPQPNATNPLASLQLDNQFSMHPSLKGLYDLYQSGTLAVVHGTGGINATRSHFDAERYMENATPTDKSTVTGWLARHLAHLAAETNSPLRAVGFGGLVQTSLRGEPTVTPIAIENIDYFGLDVADDQAAVMQSTLERLYGTTNPTSILGTQAGLAFDTINKLNSVSLENYTPDNGAVYPDNSELGGGLKQTALLIKSNLGLEVACMDMGGWVTHEHAGTNAGYLSDLIKEFSNSIAAFVKDMGTDMDHITIVTMSEFGRRVEENASQGLDHGHGNVMFLAGGGVNGGKVYSDWRTLANLDDGDVQITIDQRAVLWEMLNKRLGSTAFAQTFPNYDQPDPLNIFKA